MQRSIGGYLSIFLFFIATRVLAQSIDFPSNFADFQSADIKVTIENFVRIVVGFLGYFIIVLIIGGGLKWMASGGDEEKVAAAKKMLSATIVGTTIIFMAYAIANFLIKSLQEAL